MAKKDEAITFFLFPLLEGYFDQIAALLNSRYWENIVMRVENIETNTLQNLSSICSHLKQFSLKVSFFNIII